MQDNDVIPQSEIRLIKLAKPYSLRCTECELSKSKKGDPMLVQKFEIHSMEPINQNGTMVEINGIEINNWAVMTPKALGMFNVQRKALGLRELSSPAEFATVNPKDYVGQECFGLCSSEETQEKNDIDGGPVINPRTGKPITRWNKRINQFI